MDPNTKAKINLVINVSAAAFGVLMSAAQPQNRWQWIQFGAGIGVAILGVLRATWNETPGKV